MPWYAQRAGLPHTHRHYADAGSELARVWQHLGYVEVSAPGSDDADDQAAKLPDDAEPVTPNRRGKGRNHVP